MKLYLEIWHNLKAGTIKPIETPDGKSILWYTPGERTAAEWHEIERACAEIPRSTRELVIGD